jgi:1,2-diacylglycerol-3-alpha-glucose alpha-1,2-galactosyltransferase
VKKLVVNVVSESAYMFKAQGVHSVFRTTVEMLRASGLVDVRVNSLRACDILHAHIAGPFWYVLRPFYRGRAILSAHVVPESFKQGIIGYSRLEPLWIRYVVSSFNSADHVIPVSPAVKKNLESRGVKAPQTYIPNPIDRALFRKDPELRARGRALLGVSPTVKVVLGVGLTVLRKGIDEFVEVARRNPAVTFVWVGGNSFSVFTDGYFHIHDLMASAPPNMKFAGIFPIEKLPELYNAADAFFLPTRQDNFPMVIVEAAACGLPIVLRDIPDFREIFSPGYMPADGVDGFSHALNRILAEPDHAHTLSERALALAARYDTCAVAARLVECYQRLYEQSMQARSPSRGSAA